jgi:hypothetical protein
MGKRAKSKNAKMQKCKRAMNTEQNESRINESTMNNEQ